MTIEQKIELLYNKYISKTESPLFSPNKGFPFIMLQNILSDEIPTTNPLKESEQTETLGIIKKFYKEPLTQYTNSNIFYNDNINKIISIDWGFLDYDITLYKKDYEGNYTIPIPKGYKNYFIDKDTGILIFLDGTPYNVKDIAITCYCYVGETGKFKNYVESGYEGTKGLQGTQGYSGKLYENSLNYKGNWSSSILYEPYDFILHNNSAYISLSYNQNNQPPSNVWYNLTPQLSQLTIDLPSNVYFLDATFDNTNNRYNNLTDLFANLNLGTDDIYTIYIFDGTYTISNQSIINKTINIIGVTGKPILNTNNIGLDDNANLYLHNIEISGTTNVVNNSKILYDNCILNNRTGSNSLNTYQYPTIEIRNSKMINGYMLLNSTTLHIENSIIKNYFSINNTGHIYAINSIFYSNDSSPDYIFSISLNTQNTFQSKALFKNCYFNYSDYVFSISNNILLNSIVVDNCTFYNNTLSNNGNIFDSSYVSENFVCLNKNYTNRLPNFSNVNIIPANYFENLIYIDNIQPLPITFENI